MKRIVLAAVILFAGGLGAAARAQQAPAAEKARDIERFLHITRAGEVGVQFIEDFLPIVQRMFELELAELPQVERDRAKRIMEEELRREFTAERMVVALIPVYDKHLSAEEVKALLAFWESPAGRKFAALQPQILKEAGDVGAGMGQVVLDRIIERMAAEIKTTAPANPRPPARRRP